MVFFKKQPRPGGRGFRSHVLSSSDFFAGGSFVTTPSAFNVGWHSRNILCFEGTTLFVSTYPAPWGTGLIQEQITDYKESEVD